MSGLRQRIFSFLLGQDEALNGLGGGKHHETLSGSAGRAVVRGYWWGKPAVAVIDAVLGKGHCAAQAAFEIARREAEALHQ